MDARIFVAALSSLLAFPAVAAPVTFFSTGDPDGKMATASRPESPGKFEIESGDDFVISSPMLITSATFTGLLQNADVTNIGEVARRDLSRVSERFGRHSHDRVAHVLNRQGPDSREFAVRCGVRRSRYRKRKSHFRHQ